MVFSYVSHPVHCPVSSSGRTQISTKTPSMERSRVTDCPRSVQLDWTRSRARPVLEHFPKGSRTWWPSLRTWPHPSTAVKTTVSESGNRPWFERPAETRRIWIPSPREASPSRWGWRIRQRGWREENLGAGSPQLVMSIPFAQLKARRTNCCIIWILRSDYYFWSCPSGQRIQVRRS